jgi:hypothetical protein
VTATKKAVVIGEEVGEEGLHVSEKCFRVIGNAVNAETPLQSFHLCRKTPVISNVKIASERVEE